MYFIKLLTGFLVDCFIGLSILLAGILSLGFIFIVGLFGLALKINVALFLIIIRASEFHETVKLIKRKN